MVTIAAVAALVTACAGPGGRVAPTPDLADSIPVPAGATEVGPQSHAADGGKPVVGFESPLAPREALASYRATLASSGYTEVGTDGAWRIFSDGTRTLAVRVAADGPPTSIVVRVVADHGPAAARPSASPVDPPGAGGSDPTRAPAARTPAPSGNQGGGGAAPTPAQTPRPKPSTSPEPTPPAAAPTAAPPGQGGTPPGQGGTPPGQGGTPPGQGSPASSVVPTPEPPTPSPSAEPSDTPHPTPKPHPTPDPTKPPKPDPTPKPSKSPKP
jgi:hypothetical protein